MTPEDWKKADEYVSAMAKKMIEAQGKPDSEAKPKFRTMDESQSLNPTTPCDGCGVMTGFRTNGMPQCQNCYLLTEGMSPYLCFKCDFRWLNKGEPESCPNCGVNFDDTTEAPYSENPCKCGHRESCHSSEPPFECQHDCYCAKFGAVERVQPEPVCICDPGDGLHPGGFEKDCPVHGEPVPSTSVEPQVGPIRWPEIPTYLKNPIVFEDKNLGIAMVAGWGDKQWIFRIHHGQWCSVRETNADDPLFIKPLNKVAADSVSHLPTVSRDCRHCGHNIVYSLSAGGWVHMPDETKQCFLGEDSPGAEPSVSHPPLEQEAREWLEREGFYECDISRRNGQMIDKYVLSGVLAAFVRERSKRA